MNTDLLIPDGDGGDKTRALSMSGVYRAMTRIDEIAITNTQKAPELLSCFVRAYSTLTDHLDVVGTEVIKAKNAVANRVAIVTLDEAPRILREKGLISARSPGGSEDLRKSVLEVDAIYVRLRDRLQELEAYQKLLEGKQETIEQSYLAVRKIVGGDRFEFKNSRLGSSMPDTVSEPDAPRAINTETRVFSEQHVVPTKPRSIQDDLRASFGTVAD